MEEEINKLYNDAIRSEVGDTVRVRSTVYEGEIALTLMIQCVKIDIPPVGGDSSIGWYRIQIVGLEHDMLMYILTSMKDVFTLDECQKNLPAQSYGSSRSKIQKELNALGISHMGKWVTCRKNKTYTLSIRHLRYRQCQIICKILFSW
jgi:hypothetical protein